MPISALNETSYIPVQEDTREVGELLLLNLPTDAILRLLEYTDSLTRELILRRLGGSANLIEEEDQLLEYLRQPTGMFRVVADEAAKSHRRSMDVPLRGNIHQLDRLSRSTTLMTAKLEELEHIMKRGVDLLVGVPSKEDRELRSWIAYEMSRQTAGGKAEGWNTSESERASLKLNPSPTAPREARSFVEKVLDDWGWEEMYDTSALLVSELVTNSSIHGHGCIILELEKEESTLVVRVSDDSPVMPVVREASESASTGRGMFLVEALTTAWGSAVVNNGKIIWFVLDRRNLL